MADAETIRIQVHLSPELHPELFTALAGLRPRGRAERVRQLALMGLAGVQAQATGAVQARAEDSLNQSAVGLSPTRARLLQGLLLAD